MERSQVAVVFGSFLFRSLSLVGFIRQFVHPGLCFGICPDSDDFSRYLHGEAFRQRLEDTIEKALIHAPIMPSIRRPGEPSAAAGSPPWPRPSCRTRAWRPSWQCQGSRLTEPASPGTRISDTAETAGSTGRSVGIAGIIFTRWTASRIRRMRTEYSSPGLGRAWSLSYPKAIVRTSHVGQSSKTPRYVFAADWVRDDLRPDRTNHRLLKLPHDATHRHLDLLAGVLPIPGVSGTARPRVGFAGTM